MIKRVAEPDETRLERAQIERFERQRLEEIFSLSRRFNRRVVPDRFAGETAADSVDGTLPEFEDRPPSGLERDSTSRLGEDWIEAADRRLCTSSGDPFDKARKTVESWEERKDPDQLENAAEPRQGQHAIGVVKLSTNPAPGRRDRCQQ